MKLSMRQLERTGVCSACGYDVRLHYDDTAGTDRMVGCAGATKLYAVDRGRLLQLKLQKNEEARVEAMGTIRRSPTGKWQAKVGGRLHGAWYEWPTRRVAELYIEGYYNARALEATINPKQEGTRGDTERGIEASRPE